MKFEKITIASARPKGALGKSTQQYFVRYLPEAEGYDPKLRLEILTPQKRTKPIDEITLKDVEILLKDLRGHTIRSLSFADTEEYRTFISNLIKGLAYFEYKMGLIKNQTLLDYKIEGTEAMARAGYHIGLEMAKNE